MTRLGLLLALALLGLPGPCRADIVTLADGRVLEGSVETSGSTLIIRQRLGEVRVDQSQVVSVRETQDAWDDLARLRHELASGTADERYRFAVFCRENGFEAEARTAFLAVLRVDTDHPGARAALGYVREDERWITLEDRSRAQGLVLHEGEWVAPAERARRIEQARAAALARRQAREAEQAEAQARRDVQRAQERTERHERVLAYERALARERARQRARDEAYATSFGGSAGFSSYPGYYVPGGRFRVLSSPWGYGLLNAPCPVVIPRSSCGGRRSGQGFGLQLNGSYRGNGWSLGWRLGF